MKKIIVIEDEATKSSAKANMCAYRSKQNLLASNRSSMVMRHMIEDGGYDYEDLEAICRCVEVTATHGIADAKEALGHMKKES